MKKCNSYTTYENLVKRLVSLEQDLHKASMPETARAVNKAVQKIGWERARQLESGHD